ncbi:MAG TPA: FtsX-like permease family protein [Pilimelia sp.]|nr:FtsX-like permease family protein [Pilimelia sp.]
MLRANLRGLLHRKLRLTLAVIAIVLGVGFFSGSLVLSDTLGDRFRAMFTSLTTNVDVEVAARQVQGQPSPRPPLLTDADLARIRAVPGVAAVAPNVTAQSVVPYDRATGKALPRGGPPQVGMGVGADGDPLGQLQMAEGRWPTAPGEVAVTRFTATKAHTGVGQNLKVFIPRLQQPREYRVVGTVTYSGGRDSLGGETVVLLPMAEAQQAFHGAAGRYDGVSLAAADDVADTALRDRVAGVLPPQFEAKTGKESSEAQAAEITDAISGLTTYVLTPFAGVALLVGVFLIFNTFNVLVTQRGKELAMMRALGASRGQVTVSVLVEALVVGVVGATLGLALGVAIGGLGSWALSQVGDAPLPGSGITVGVATVLAAYGIGVFVTVVAALVPALRASRVPPLAAMRDIVNIDRPLRARGIVGAVVTAAAVGLIAVGLRQREDGLTLVSLGCVAAFLAVIAVAPLVTRPVGRAVGALVGWGVSGNLGVRNATRNPRRTAVTASALMIGVMLVTGASVIAASFKESINRELTSTLKTELTVSAGSGLDAPLDGSVGVSEPALVQLRALPGVQDVIAFRMAFAPQINGTVYETIGVGTVDNVPGAQRTMGLSGVAGEVRTLRDGELLADEKTARDQGFGLGDSVRVGLPGGEHTYRVVGLMASTPLWANFVMLPDSAASDFAGPLAPQAMIDVRDDADVSAVKAEVENVLVDFPMVTVADKSTTMKQVTTLFDTALMIITVLLSLAMVIALLGILNTLLLSIIERTRELGMLRAIGLGRRGLVRMIGTEALLMSVFGGLLGVGVGVGIGAALARSLVYQDFLSGVWLPWDRMAAALHVAAVAGLVAAIIPAIRAARLNVLDAIAYE